MNKEEILNDFLKGLRIVLNNASAYSKDHPYFRQSVEVFQQKVKALLPFLSPIKISFAPESLFIDGNKLEKSMLYVDLAVMFHKRKIKSIEIRPGFTTSELIELLSSVALPVKEILKSGGAQNILDKVKSTHLAVEELDYSQFLQEQGEEARDIWAYLFKEAVRKENPAEINEFADNFKGIIAKFKARDLFEDNELRENLHSFLGYLKNKEKNKFDNCSKELLKHILKDKSIAVDDGVDKMKALFQDMGEDSLADALWDQISNNEAFNYSSFQLFSRLVTQGAHKAIASNLGEKVKSAQSLRNSSAVRKKIKELFSGTGQSSTLEFYRQEVYSPFVNASWEESLSFDRDFLPVNYFLILLNLFSMEDNKERLSLISRRLLGECDRLICQKKTEYLNNLWQVLEDKNKADTSLAAGSEEFKKRIYDFVENESFEEEPAEGLECLVSKTERSVKGKDFYFEQIFDKRKASLLGLSLFFKFFPGELPRFYDRLKALHAEIEFAARIVKTIERLEPAVALEMLKNIFSFSGNVIKVEVLRSMQVLAVIDEAFLFPLLGKEDIFLKKEAFVILAKDPDLRKKALEKLLSIRSPFGKRNQLIIQNLMAIEGKNIEGARDYITPLSKRRFFWNKNLREKAREILRKWNAGKD